MATASREKTKKGDKNKSEPERVPVPCFSYFKTGSKYFYVAWKDSLDSKKQKDPIHGTVESKDLVYKAVSKIVGFEVLADHSNVCEVNFRRQVGQGLDVPLWEMSLDFLWQPGRDRICKYSGQLAQLWKKIFTQRAREAKEGKDGVKIEYIYRDESGVDIDYAGLEMQAEAWFSGSTPKREMRPPKYVEKWGVYRVVKKTDKKIIIVCDRSDKQIAGTRIQNTIHLDREIFESKGYQVSQSYGCFYSEAAYREKKGQYSAKRRKHNYGDAPGDVAQHLETFDLEPGFGLEALKQSYRRLTKIYHPDVTEEADKEKATEIFRDITTGYERLRSYLETGR